MTQTTLKIIVLCLISGSLLNRLCDAIETSEQPTIRYRDMDMDSLRLIQLVHTHGDRTPSRFVRNDPFSSVPHFWPEGIGQLTKLGRNRMFRVGEFFHNVYHDFITIEQIRAMNIESMIKVYSSGYRRCLESATTLVTGLIGGSNSVASADDFANLTNYWTPIPVKSVSPKGTDPLLDVDFPCPELDNTFHEMLNQDPIVKRIEQEHKLFLNEISFYAGEKIGDWKDVNSMYQELFIENQYNYHWWRRPHQIWTEQYEQYALNQLRELSQKYWRILFSDPQIQRLIGGVLIKQINDNIRSFVNGSDTQTKIFVYSSHDGKIIAILQAFGIYDSHIIKPGTTMAFELHQNLSLQHEDPIQNHFVRFHFYNETDLTNLIYEMYPAKFCHLQSGTKNIVLCPLDRYLQALAPIEQSDILYECGIEIRLVGAHVNLALLVSNSILMIFLVLALNICAFKAYKKRR